MQTPLQGLFILKPRANVCNIVGQQLPTLSNVTCCVHWHTLLHVVAMLLCVVGSCCTKFETGQSYCVHLHI